MIGLDEDMTGLDNEGVIIQELKVCLGLFGRTMNGRLFGAHFTPATTRGNMDLLLDNLYNVMPASVQWLGMASKFNHWTNSASGLTTPTALSAYFRSKFGFRGTVYYMDMVTAANSYDLLFEYGGFVPRLSSRTTPAQPNYQQTPRNNVFGLERTVDRQAALQGRRVPVVNVHPANGANRRVTHRLPNNQGGFNVVGAMTPLAAPVIGTARR